LRLRAEEVRAIAGEMTVEENRLVLDRIAADYERLAQCAELISDSRRKLALLDMACASPSAPADGECSPSQEHNDKIIAYRDMAADALALAGVAMPAARDRWWVLAKLWTKLADDLESQSREPSS
jgi:hypothetical protein